MKFICGIKNPRTHKVCNAKYLGLKDLMEHYYKVHTASGKPPSTWRMGDPKL